MEKMSELSSLASELESVRPRSKNQPWPESVKKKVASGIQEGKFSIQEASKATGISKATIYSWSRRPSSGSKKSLFSKKVFRRVKVSDVREISVSGPKGFIIRGLCFEEVKSLVSQELL